MSLTTSDAKVIPTIDDKKDIVPFILALGAGVAAVRGGKNATDDSFGLVGMASIGPIISTALLILFQASIPEYSVTPVSDMNIAMRFLDDLIPSQSGTGSLIEVLIALLPIIVIFFTYNFLYFIRHSSKC